MYGRLTSKKQKIDQVPTFDSKLKPGLDQSVDSRTCPFCEHTAGVFFEMSGGDRAEQLR